MQLARVANIDVSIKLDCRGGDYQRLQGPCFLLGVGDDLEDIVCIAAVEWLQTYLRMWCPGAMGPQDHNVPHMSRRVCLKMGSHSVEPWLQFNGPL